MRAILGLVLIFLFTGCAHAQAKCDPQNESCPQDKVLVVDFTERK